jgi:hypothetical protein
VLLALVTLPGCGAGADLLAPSAGRPSIDPISTEAGVTVVVPVDFHPVNLEARFDRRRQPGPER